MKTRMVELPEELLDRLAQTKLGECDEAERVRIALAAFLFERGGMSVGRAAELAQYPRANFELLLGAMDIPPVRYELEDYLQDVETLERLRERQLEFQ